jgi:hypothetical protein
LLCIVFPYVILYFMRNAKNLIYSIISRLTTNYKFVTALSFHQKNNYSHIYWMLTLKIIEHSGCETLTPKSGLFRWSSNCSLVPRPLSTPITRFCTLMWWRASVCNVTENKGLHGGIGTSELSMSGRTWLFSVESENMITKANSLGKNLIKIRIE